MGATCEPEEDGSYHCNVNNFDNRYYLFELRVTLAEGIIAMAASYSLAVWFGEKKMPFFISAICLCTIIATLCMNYLETMASRTYTGQGG